MTGTAKSEATMRLIRPFLPFLLIFVIAAGCAGPTATPGGAGGASGQPQQGVPKRVVAVMRGSPFTLSHAINSAGAGSVPGVDELQDLIHAGLGVEDNQRQLQPRLAVDLPSIENGLWKVFPDGRMETTWKLRPNVQWHDGARFSVEDLTFTVRVAQDRRVALGGTATYSLIEEVQTPDPLTLTVRWSQTFTKADALLTQTTGGANILPMPRHLVETSYIEDPATFTELSFWTTKYVGLGPFRLKEFFEGSHLLLEANDHYFLGRPKVQEIEVKFMPDPSTIAANLLAGAVELTLGGRFSPEWGKQVRDQWGEGRMDALISTSWLALFPQFLNPSPPVLAELPFRRALMHAIDRKEMSDTIQDGLSPVAHAIVGPHDPEYKDLESLIVRYEFDPRAAAQLIESLGYTKGTDGMYLDRAGQRLSLEMRTRQGDDLQEKTLFGVAGYWQRAGVGVEPVIFPPQRAPDREYRSTRPAFEVVRQPAGADAVTRYLGSDIPLPENSFRGVNRTRYKNPELDALLDRYVATIPRRERVEILARIVNHMTTNLIVYGIYWALDPTMIGNALINVGGMNPTWNAHEWDVKR